MVPVTVPGQHGGEADTWSVGASGKAHLVPNLGVLRLTACWQVLSCSLCSYDFKQDVFTSAQAQAACILEYMHTTSPPDSLPEWQCRLEAALQAHRVGTKVYLEATNIPTEHQGH